MEFSLEAEKYREDFLNLLAQWVKIRSVYDEKTIKESMPFGKGVAEALEWFVALGKNDGFTTKNIDGYAAHVEYGSGDEYVYAFGHCDVVPEGEGWDYDPFTLSRSGKKIIGRGVIDDKGPVLAAYLALKLLKDNNILPKRRIRVVAGGNEESGFKCIRHYFKKEPKPIFGFTPDAKFPVINGEMGGGVINIKGVIDDKIIKIKGGQVHNTIPSHVIVWGCNLDDNIINSLKEDNIEIKYINDKSMGRCIKLAGKGGHSSKPEKANNPIEKAFKLIHNISDRTWTAEFYSMFGGENIDGKLFGINKCGKCGSIKLVPTIIDIEDGIFNMTLSVRYPEISSIDEVSMKIREYFMRHGLGDYEIVSKDIKKPNYVDENSLLVETLYNVYLKHTGDNKNKVRTTSAGTYASEMENSVVFGGEFPWGFSGNAHMQNEYGNEDEFIKSIGIYAEAFYELCRL